MIPSLSRVAAISTALLLPVGAHAAACDYKPSKLAGKAGTAVSSGVKASTSIAVDGAKAAGHYALLHPGQGLAMASSAAGTASGIAAGAGGVAATIGAILTAPITLTVGAVTFGAVGAYEGLCYFQVERVTDIGQVRAILENAAANDPLTEIVEGEDGDRLVLTYPDGTRSYALRKLYIADGELRHRDWGPNTNLGTIAFVSPEAGE